MTPNLMETLLRFILVFVYPLGLSLALLLVAGLAAFFGRRKTSILLSIVSTGLLWTSATPLVASYLVARLEAVHPPLAIEDTPRSDAIVMLGGALAMIETPYTVKNRVTSTSANLSEASDRILHTARLYRAGKAPLVVIASGVDPDPNVRTEAHLIAELLVEWGVAEEDIAMERRSTTTRENALETLPVLRDRGLDQVLLVTSALHMPRALATFETAGINAIPAVTDVLNPRPDRTQLETWLPNAGALHQSTLAIHESLGTAVYRARGWIRDTD